MVYAGFEKKEFYIVTFLVVAVMFLLLIGGYMLGEINGENVMRDKVTNAVNSDKAGFCSEICSDTIYSGFEGNVNGI